MVRTYFGFECSGVPAGAGGSGGSGSSGGWGDWETEPWTYELLYAFGLSNWDDFNAWVPEADSDELRGFLDTLMVLVTAGQ